MEATEAVAKRPETVLGEKDKTNTNAEAKTVVALSSLSEMTGFPVDFIKSELFVEGEELSMDELRKSMAGYLESTFQEVQ